MQTREQLEKKFSTSRGNLLAVIIFTCVNIILTIANTDLYFLFSANIPMFLLYFGSEWELTGGYTFSAFAIIAAFIAVSVYGLFWYRAKKHMAWIVAALVYFSIDVLVMVWLFTSASLEFDFSLVIELAFIAWIMYYLVTGTRAWLKLRKMPPDEEPEYDGQDESEQYEQSEGEQSEVKSKEVVTLKTIPVAQIPPSTAIRPPSKKGKVLISQNYNNMELVVKRAFGATELIVDGMVYAEKTGLHEGKTYILEANVNNAIINATTEIMTTKEAIAKEVTEKDKIKDFLPTVYLYVNGNLVAEKVRYF